MYRALGQWSFRHWKTVAALWVIAIAIIVGAASTVGSSFDASIGIPDSEAQDGFGVLDEYFGGQGSGQSATIVFQTDRGIDDPQVTAAMTELIDFTQSLDDRILVFSPYDPEGDQQIAAEGPQAGNIAFAEISIADEVTENETVDYGADIRDKADEVLAESGLTNDVQVELGGQSFAPFSTPRSEFVGVGFAVIVLILAFGSVVAMGLPIGVATGGVGAGIATIILLTNAIDIPEFAIQIGAMVGLGVGIDYALFIVTRYRDELAAGHNKIDAVGIALDTAGRAVIFAGLTVVVSLLGMLFMGLAFVSGLGIGAASTVAITMAASITLLPALLGAVGDRVHVTRVRGLVSAALAALALFAFGMKLETLAYVSFGLAAAVLILGAFIPILKRVVPHRAKKPIRETLPYRWSRMIQARPWAFMIGSGALLLLLSAPVFGLRLGFSDEGNFPEESTTRKAYDLVAEGFGPGFNGPLLIAVELDSPGAIGEVEQLQAAIEATDGVAQASPPLPNDFDNPAAVLIQVIPDTAPQDAETVDLVKTLRNDVIPANTDGLTVSVTGATPANIDFSSFLTARLVLFFSVVLAVSFLLLMAVFRSLVVPLKAVLMNVLSIGAAYGVIVAVFQWGWFESILGIAAAPIEPFIPMMLFAIVFGLSMDYEVFLLSRVKEEYERTGDPKNSVADGLASTARVITAAASIMIVVFGSFLFEDDRTIKMFGTGLAVAVLLDATLVRLVLVPATMELLGARNWWLPRWLDRIVPNLNIEGTPLAAPQDPLDEPIDAEPVFN